MSHKGCDSEFEIFMNIEIFLKIFSRKPNYLTRTSCVGAISCSCSVNHVTSNSFEVEYFKIEHVCEIFKNQ